MHMLWCRTNICSCKHSAKVSLMLDNTFPVPSLCKLHHSSGCFIQIKHEDHLQTAYSLQGKAFFWSDPWCFGPLGKFQHNIEIRIKMTRVSRLSFRFSWLWLQPIINNSRLIFKYVQTKDALLVVKSLARKHND